MSNFNLPRDANSGVLQALAPVESVVNNINTTAVSFALPAKTDVVRIAVSQNSHVKFGLAGVTATTSDLFFPTGAELFSVKGRGFTHVSILGTSATPSAASVTKMA
jgi:hypothetical protein